ncbi:hypothetical protein FZEAL_7038 [Fusarium zealandicum]|uniref:L-lactate dehydrogenase (cytochrome) n=1 Tax=Fusarium zealandicum TaxID=1053134 RepID=A0A8H4UH50_9HYPO|nr:hypothetical protein FZEAL_7038 [Fusarium zealandicum]
MEDQLSSRPRISLSQLGQHNTKSDCWIAVHSRVWNVTEFLDEHPGGSAVILRHAGSNATQIYDAIHAPEIIEELTADKLMGHLDEMQPLVSSSLQQEAAEPATTADAPSSQTTPQPEDTLAPLETLLSAADFEKVASKRLSPKTWAFYSSAATDLITHHQNKAMVRRVMIRPRILRNVKNIDMRRNILGLESSAPFFISPAAMARLAHTDGELALSRAAANEGIIQCVSSNASYPLKSIVNAAPPSQPFFFQIYINSDRHKTLELLKNVRDLGIRALFVTVDAPVPGKREADERAGQETTVTSAISGGSSSKDKKGSGFGRLMAQYIDKSLCWDDLKWIREAIGGIPIVLKGVQSAEDVKKAAELGVEGVLLSNHGGRSLDGSQASILVLLEIRQQCPEVFDQLEIYVDGGFERGSDILKAIALGATAVGIGRPFLYSLVYGQDGAEHLSQILKDELETSMRLCGVRSLNELVPRIVNTRDIDHLVDPGDEHNRQPPQTARRFKL